MSEKEPEEFINKRGDKRGITAKKNFEATRLDNVSPERRKEVAAMGGKTKTEKTKKSKWLNAMIGLERAEVKLLPATKRLIAMVRDEEVYSVEILREIDKIRRDNPELDVKDHLALVALMNQTHKTIHGEKKSLEVSGHTTQDVRVAEVIKVVLDAEEKKTKKVKEE